MLIMTNVYNFQMDINYFQAVMYLYLEYLWRIILWNI